MLSRLLSTGRGTTEALLFALLVRDRERDGGHEIDDPVKAATLARCLRAYSRLAWFLQLQVETSLMGLLVADRLGMDTLLSPERFEHLITAGNEWEEVGNKESEAKERAAPWLSSEG